MFLRLLYPIHIEKSIERNGNFRRVRGDAFSIPQRGERILSIRAREGGGAGAALRAQDAGWRRKKSPPVHPHAKPGGCSVPAKSVPTLIARRPHAPAPPRRSPHRFPESFVPPVGVRTAGDLRPPASRPRPFTAGKSAFSARKHKNNRKKYMKTRKALENEKQMMYNHKKEKYKEKYKNRI